MSVAYSSQNINEIAGSELAKDGGLRTDKKGPMVLELNQDETRGEAVGPMNTDWHPGADRRLGIVIRSLADVY